MSRSRPFYKRFTLSDGRVVTLAITSPASRTQESAVYQYRTSGQDGKYLIFRKVEGRWSVHRRQPTLGFECIGQGYRTIGEALDLWIA